MGHGRRAQASVEYVVNYGWAILVLLVTGIVLWQLGVFNNQNTSMTSNGFGKIKPVLGGTKLAAGGDLEVPFTNGVGAKIYVKEVNVSNFDDGTTICCIPASACPPYVASAVNNVAGADDLAISTSPPKIAAGDVFKVSLTGCDIDNARQGEAYNIQIDIDYDALSGNSKIPHGDSGNIRGMFE